MASDKVREGKLIDDVKLRVDDASASAHEPDDADPGSAGLQPAFDALPNQTADAEISSADGTSAPDALPNLTVDAECENPVDALDWGHDENASSGTQIPDGAEAGSADSPRPQVQGYPRRKQMVPPREMALRGLCGVAVALVAVVLVVLSMLAFFGSTTVLTLDVHTRFFEPTRATFLVIHSIWLGIAHELLGKTPIEVFSRFPWQFWICIGPAIPMAVHLMFCSKDLSPLRKTAWWTGLIVTSYFLTPIVVPFYFFTRLTWLGQQTRIMGSILVASSMVWMFPQLLCHSGVGVLVDPLRIIFLLVFFPYVIAAGMDGWKLPCFKSK